MNYGPLFWASKFGETWTIEYTEDDDTLPKFATGIVVALEADGLILHEEGYDTDPTTIPYDGILYVSRGYPIEVIGDTAVAYETDTHRVTVSDTGLVLFHVRQEDDWVHYDGLDTLQRNELLEAALFNVVSLIIDPDDAVDRRNAEKKWA